MFTRGGTPTKLIRSYLFVITLKQVLIHLVFSLSVMFTFDNITLQINILPARSSDEVASRVATERTATTARRMTWFCILAEFALA